MTSPRSDRVRAAAIALGAFVFHAVFAARYPVFGDGMEIVATAAVAGVAHPSGYPTLTTLLSPIATGEGAYFRAALLCAAFIAVAVGLVRSMIGSAVRLALAGPSPRAVLTADLLAVAFALSFSFLDAATVVEVYALNALFLAALVLLLAPRPDKPLSLSVLLAASLLQGIAATNHLTSLCTGPLLAWRALQAILAAPRSAALIVPSTAVAFAAGLSPYLLVPVRAAASPAINWGDAQSLDAILWMIRGGEYRERQFLRAGLNEFFTLETWLPFAARRTWDMLRSLGGQFLGGPQTGRPFAGSVAGLLGIVFAGIASRGFLDWWKLQRMTALTLLMATLLQAAFVLLYNIPDIEDYHLGILVTLLPFFATGFGTLLLVAWRDESSSPITPHRHWVVPGVLVCASALSALPLYRANADIGAAWTERVLAAATPNAMILTHSDYDLYPLWYAQHSEGRRADLLVVGINFLRYEWYDRMMPPHRPDAAGRTVFSTPGHFTQFTLKDHVDAVRHGVIDPNLGKVPVFITDLDALVIRELLNHYRLVPAAQLLSEEELLLFAHSPGVPPSLLFEIQPLSPNRTEP